MRRGLLCFVLWLALAAAFPTAAAAVRAGPFDITGGVEGTAYTYAEGVLTVLDGADITISMAPGIATTTDRIVVAADAAATVTLSGVQINEAGTTPLEVTGGDVTIVLADGKENLLRGRGAGLGKTDAGLLRIVCESVYNNEPGHTCTEGECGTLRATSTRMGAGIGGAYGQNTGGITIDGGHIIAIGHNGGAGIGGGAYGAVSNITINGGIIEAHGGADAVFGAGIGGGQRGAANSIIINGGIVTATAQRAAGIGGGNDGGSADGILITGGTVMATGGTGIGGGQFGEASNITISGGTIMATGTAVNGPGIGGHPASNTKNITIDGGTVTAQAGDNVTPALGAAPAFGSYVHRTQGNAAANAESEDVVEWTGNPAGDWRIWHWVKIEPAPLGDTGTVTFHENWNGITYDRTVLRGMIFAAPPAPARDGYVFGGWYKDEACSAGQEWHFETDLMPDSDLTLYAKWTAETYDVTFSLDGDTKTVPDVQVETDALIPPPAVPARPGYTLDGWYENADFSGKTWDFGTNTMPPNTLTLYAKWTADEQTVTFDANGGAPTPPAQRVPTDGKVEKPASEPVRPGYTLDGWYENADFSGKAWDFGTNTMPPNALTLYAKWTANEQTVTFDANGGAPVPSEQKIPTDGLIPEPAPPRKGSYLFSGWYTAGGTRWDFGRDRMPPNDLVLYARWTANDPSVQPEANGSSPAPPEQKTPANEYTVTFEADGGRPVPGR